MKKDIFNPPTLLQAVERVVELSRDSKLAELLLSGRAFTGFLHPENRLLVKK